ncbi:hypothetical protein FaHV1S18_084 [Falconid herpesvirus 1]|uniref:Uncharacterized protein n=2 Tax=Columbid alphaherpesvirus 1 TaxID=93386 RepID=A0A068EW26_9ALPH|nr:hypothetical protein FaHV1S18_002 [Falconid herpesvirus 1]YP_009046568.1 hypothetical protein FaHV1S18_084 [Falconid herpesvirus 1]YP_009352896.1 hypothetical protein CoHVHLJ_002 [Columbid alphaherpesvirus 1]YP_009352978.1 hypothetical protein CoHVHLJ_084 [Columbid alphaherpesvirus 1]AID52692.1 hypothetical protein FaHV1S18_002 [Falconid herpesvirus 1]AID52774.1 hypothetical protein FaHV1S18_084 [Falconid herpesvirus 1]ARD71313.1 hypothetical protein CoHVHLJ_002 [Columbid alphaherpesvirus 
MPPALSLPLKGRPPAPPAHSRGASGGVPGSQRPPGRSMSSAKRWAVFWGGRLRSGVQRAGAGAPRGRYPPTSLLVIAALPARLPIHSFIRDLWTAAASTAHPGYVSIRIRVHARPPIAPPPTTVTSTICRSSRGARRLRGCTGTPAAHHTAARPAPGGPGERPLAGVVDMALCQVELDALQTGSARPGRLSRVARCHGAPPEATPGAPAGRWRLAACVKGRIGLGLGLGARPGSAARAGGIPPPRHCYNSAARGPWCDWGKPRREGGGKGGAVRGGVGGERRSGRSRGRSGGGAGRQGVSGGRSHTRRWGMGRNRAVRVGVGIQGGGCRSRSRALPPRGAGLRLGRGTVDGEIYRTSLLGGLCRTGVLG